ncbi:MAG: PDZ domain-containing protein [Vicinamibacterales bacterium]
MAPFTDGGRTIDRTNWPDSYISYYPYGGAMALALDLSLRQRTEGKTTLDDFMRAMWRVHGKPAAPRPGYVANPYSIDDVERRLGEVSGDPAFARSFFTRFIHGREAPDFGALLEPAGFVLQKQNPGRAWWGSVRLETRDGVIVADAPRANTPAYKAGLDLGDELRMLDGVRIASATDVDGILRRHKPGDAVSVEFVDRSGRSRTSTVTLQDDPDFRIVPIEETGRNLTSAQASFRTAWLGRKD